MKFYDVHCHFMNTVDIPLITALRRYGILLQVFTHYLPGWIDNNVRHFLRSLNIPSEYVAENTAFDVSSIKCIEEGRQIFELVLCPLIIDFNGDGGIGIEQAHKRYQQRERNLVDSGYGTKTMAFLGFNPALAIKGTGYMQTFCRLFREGGYTGIKLYPPLGFDYNNIYFHELLFSAQENETPITVHCSPGGFVSQHTTRGKARRLTDPANWGPILNDYPNLRLNFAHLGGLKRSWVRTIAGFCDRFDNVYTDVSHVLTNPRKTLKRIVYEKVPWEKVLFGSDWPMSLLNERDYVSSVLPFLSQLDSSKFNLITHYNPKKFLND